MSHNFICFDVKINKTLFRSYIGIYIASQYRRNVEQNIVYLTLSLLAATFIICYSLCKHVLEPDQGRQNGGIDQDTKRIALW